MSIKSIAFELSTQSNPKIKRNICYELIAAAFGFKSYAAATSTNHVFVSRLSPPSINNRSLSERAGILKLDQDSAIPLVASVLRRSPIEPVMINQLAHQIEEGDVIENADLYDQLERIACKGEGMAHYCLAVLYAGEMGDSKPSDYWYKQSTSGASLSEAELEFAEAYRKYIEDKRKFATHLQAAIDLKIPNAILMKMRLGEGDMPGEEHFYTDEERSEIDVWALAQLAGQGDIDAIESLARSLSSNKPVIARALIEFANHLDFDITETVTSVVDEFGNPYDDEVGGAMYPDVWEGVQVDQLSEENESRAINLASTWFEQYNIDGVAEITIK